ncbi:uncharacterized protein LOC124368840 isoform X2 [Homalodisca vitripennis]|uniref:uncharacterized protein LOC124368840 isoform X2 n=1 Tax=Homalodisca vitripennis TaxID=197043 RepID=UPI001EEB0C72|nr:uncharacterized protein LOC124368840 isoform X2 [Homalodisca vitripennis]
MCSRAQTVKLRLRYCSSTKLEEQVRGNNSLRYVDAGPIKGIEINLECFNTRLVELRLRGYRELKVVNVTALLNMLHLKTLGGTVSTNRILQEISELPSLRVLELVNVYIKAGYISSLGLCTNLKRLLVIPNYDDEMEFTNFLVSQGAFQLKSTLKEFHWGFTSEMLREADVLFDDGWGLIPVGGFSYEAKEAMKYSKLVVNNRNKMDMKSRSPNVVNLTELKDGLTTCLPGMTCKIYRMPYRKTWGKSIRRPDPCAHCGDPSKHLH